MLGVGSRVADPGGVDPDPQTKINIIDISLLYQ